jgi:photosystem II stability/assembly factor-like uncharacterized protein
VWRSDDRGDSWTKISGDLTRNLDWRVLPIMGRVWDPPPAGAPPSLNDPISLHESTTALSNVVALDESPLAEGLIYAGTDDGLLQITEDAGKTWRKIEDFPGVAKWAYISDVFASPRDSNTVFVALNNWQRGDYAPYIVKSTDRGRTFTNITGNLPAKHDVWGIIQDHINGDLLFAGTEFGAFTSVDGGKNWIMLKGNMPLARRCATSSAEELQRPRARHVRSRHLDSRRLQRTARHDGTDRRLKRRASIPTRDTPPLQHRRRCAERADVSAPNPNWAR